MRVDAENEKEYNDAAQQFKKLICKDISRFGKFGYDPIFVFADGEQTTAELDPASKNRLSHRSQALARLVKVMRDELV